MMDLCNSLSPREFSCTKEKGHGGDHIATVGPYNPLFAALDTWPQEAPVCAICGDPDGDMHSIGRPTAIPTHRFTVVKPKFWTAGDVHKWIAENVSLKDDETPEAAALWWLAVENAELLGDMNTRERASLFIDGVVPLDESSIEDKLHYMHEDIDNADDEIEADLRSFFKLEEREVKDGQGG